MNRPSARRASPLLLTAVLLWACQDGAQDSATGGSPADVVATVNGVDITRHELDAYVARREATQPGAAADRRAALDELIKLAVVEQQAEEEGLDERRDVAAELDWQRTNLLVNTFMRERMKDMSFSEEELKAEYQNQLAKLPKREYKARHILAEDRKRAAAVIEQLDAGADFTALSEAKSSAPSAPEGGDLGWFSPNTMVPPFAHAVQKLDKGEYTKEPVKTQFGWHVILLEDSREVERPAFGEVRDQVKNILTSSALQSYIEKLREEAEVEIKGKPEAQPPQG